MRGSLVRIRYVAPVNLRFPVIGRPLFYLVQPLVQPFEKIRYSFIKNKGPIYALNCINWTVLNWKSNEKNFIVVLRSFELRQEEVLLS